MKGFAAWLNQLQFDGVWQTLLLICVSLISTTVHECSHGFAAWKLGDNTAKSAGRLTLNPMKHVDVSGLLMMALFRFGWAKPVPVDARNFKSRRAGMAITAVAGPLSNILLAFICSAARILISVAYYKRQSTALYVFYVFFVYAEVINAGLAVFNLFPIPPLDGSKLLFAALPDKAYNMILRYERYGMILLMVLLFSGVADGPLLYLRNGLMEGLEKAASAVVLPIIYKLGVFYGTAVIPS